MSADKTYSEQELVDGLKSQDNEAFSYMYDNYSTALYGIIKQIVGDAEVSNDVMQEVFVNIWKKVDTYDASKGKLFTWMLNIARNASIDKLRSRNFQQSLRQVPLTESEITHPVVRPGLDDFGLKKVIYKLKGEQRMLIDLSYYQGYTHDQIAKALNIPLGTVKTRLRSALSQLRNLLN